jgi:2-iminoacetate synthase
MNINELKKIILSAKEEDINLNLLLGSKSKNNIKNIAAILKYKNLIKDKLIVQAIKLNLKLYNKEIEFYGVSYISDMCVNNCSYCGHNREMPQARRMLSPAEMKKDFSAVLKYGPSDLCILAGEHPEVSPEYLAVAGNTAIECDMKGTLDRITYNVAPMQAEAFSRLRKLLKKPIQFRVFQESYVPEIYEKYHTKGPKSNYGFRLESQKRALEAGFDYVGIGVLIGLNTINQPYQNFGNDLEILALISHAYELKKISGRLPYSLSLPRLQKVEGSNFDIQNKVDDEAYILYHAILKLALPETKTIITRRETREMIDRLRPLINIEDMATKPGVGGNINQYAHFQNTLGDSRTTEEIIRDIKEKGYRPKIKI